MADDSFLLSMRPNSIFAEAPDFHSCRYSSWSQDRGFPERHGDEGRQSKCLPGREGGRRQDSADPWQRMEGELSRLDAANIKITEVDLQCMGDSENVMYEFKLEEDPSDTIDADEGPYPARGGPVSGSHVEASHLPSGMSSQSGPMFAKRLSSSNSIQQLRRSGGSMGSGLMRLERTQAGADPHLSPHHSIQGSPTHALAVHQNRGAGFGPLRTQISHLVAASDAEVEGYFSAAESLAASPREYDADSLLWADEEQDMLKAEQLACLLFAAEDLAPGNCGALKARGVGGSPGSSLFSSPAHYLPPAVPTGASLAQGSKVRSASNLGRPSTSHAGFLSQSRDLSPKTYTSFAPPERDGNVWPVIPHRSASMGEGSPSPVRGGSRLRGASRLSSARPAAARSCGSLNIHRASAETGEPDDFVVAENAVDLEMLTSLDLGALEAQRPTKSRLASLHEVGPGGSGPLVPRQDIFFSPQESCSDGAWSGSYNGSRSFRGGFNPNARRMGWSASLGQEGSTTELSELSTGNQVSLGNKGGPSRTLSWSMEKDTDFLGLAADPAMPYIDVVNSESGDKGAIAGPRASPLLGYQGSAATLVPGAAANKAEAGQRSQNEDASEHTSLLKRLSKKMGWRKKPEHCASSSSIPLTGVECQQRPQPPKRRSFAAEPDCARGAAILCPSGDAVGIDPKVAVLVEPEPAVAPPPSKYTMSRKKRQELERMQFTRSAVAQPLEVSVSIARTASDLW